ncbi:hypothetical protein [Hymenobacter cavernae]|uniref:DNA-binding protein n=1 Tax=Hymenobacter cavernae TaxID=2044852 RepID=A0ABQ1TZK5_9BACT|nr:hypothetical protein [Hymenobacter cavernae]GGF07519.1 hypothetical protein GCM10011383_18270 [Hymenobacter cavernae]
MKNGIYALAVLTLMISSSCQKDDDDSLTSLAACSIETEVVGKANQYEGYVRYVAEEQRYAIAYHIPRTIDSQIYGVVCNLPEEFQQEGKKVKFSGTYRKYNGPAKPVFGGQSFEYLELKSIEEL